MGRGSQTILVTGLYIWVELEYAEVIASILAAVYSLRLFPH